MTRSTALFLVACLVAEVVPFGWLFVAWAIVAAIPVLAFGLLYLPIAAMVHHGGRWVTEGPSRMCNSLNQNRKEKS